MKKFTFARLTLFVLALLQFVSQLLQAVLEQKTISNHFMLNILVSLGESICNNWVSFSLTLMFVVIGYLIYKSICISEDNRQSKEYKEYKKCAIRALIMVMINLALCNKIYSTVSINQKVTFLKTHIDTVVLLTIILACATVVILLIRNENQVKQDIEKMKTDGKDSAEAKDLLSASLDKDELVKFKMMHPVSYYFRTLVAYNTEKKKLKQEREKKLIKLQMQYDEEEGKKKLHNLPEKVTIAKASFFESKPWKTFEIIVSVGLTLAVIGIAIYSIIRHNLLSVILNPDEIKQNLEKLDFSSTAAMELLQRVGMLFLIIAVFFVAFLIIYIIIRITLYLIFVHVEDEDLIKRCAKVIKALVFTSFDSGMRLLLFIPDFVEKVENVLLSTNIDEKIQELYPEVGKGGARGIQEQVAQPTESDNNS